jgi:pimeloyl-ACP methyl ester carboxylesterase
LIEAWVEHAAVAVGWDIMAHPWRCPPCYWTCNPMTTSQDVSASHRPDHAGVFRHSTVAASDGLLLDLFEAGDPHKPPVVLINAYGMPAAFWEPLATDLQSDHHVITWESRGVPNLDQPFDPRRCGVAEHTDDLRAVLDAKGVDRPRVVAWCTGAQVTLRFASLSPERLESAVLLSGSFRTLPGVPLSEFQSTMNFMYRECAPSRTQSELYYKMVFAGAAGGAPSARPQPAAKSAPKSPWGDVPAPLLKLTSTPFQTAESLFRYANMLVAVENEPAHAWMEAPQMPLLLVGGGCDTVVHPQTWTEASRRLQRSRLIVKADASHYLLYQDRELAHQIRGFFADAAGSP